MALQLAFNKLFHFGGIQRAPSPMPKEIVDQMYEEVMAQVRADNDRASKEIDYGP